MSNPLSMFRRHQKVLLAVFGVLIIITFTVGGVITSVQRRQMGYAVDSQAVVTWKHGKLSEQDMRYERETHNLTVRFLDRLIQATIDAEGTPKGIGLNRDMQTGQITDPGIPRSFAERDLVQTKLLAQKARDMGMRVSEEAIFDFLETLSDDEVPREKYGKMLSDATGGRFVKLQLFDRLETELLAQNMRIMTDSGSFEMMARRGTFAMSPDRAWDYFNRMNRRIKAEVLPLPVADFESKVSGEPSEAEIEGLYEAGKDRYSDPESPEPGFKRRRKIEFEYLKADFEKFLEDQMAAVTDEQVQAYYEENKSDFKAIELPPATDEITTPEDGTGDAEPTGDDAEMEPDSAPAEPESSAAPTGDDAEQGTKPETPAEEPAQENTGETDDSEATDTPAEPADGGEAESGPSLEAPSNPAPDADQGEPPAAPDQSRDLRSERSAETMFVSFNAQEEDADTGADEPDAPAETEASDPPAEEADPAAEEAAETDDKATAQPPDASAGDTATPTDQPAATADQSQEEADNAAAQDQPDPKLDTDAAEVAEEPGEQEVKYKPLEEVADEIRRNLARAPAQEATNDAIKDARSEIEKYFKQRARYKALKEDDPDLEKPVEPDPEALAEKYGLVAGDTPLVDELEIADFELGKAYQFSFAQRQMAQISFAQIAYNNGLPLYKADQIRSFEVDVEFLYWKVDEKEPNVPELKDIRKEVVDAWTQQKAFELAKSHAESLVEKAQGGNSLKESLDDQQAKEVVETNEFSWMTHGAMPVGYGAPSLSSVDGVQSPGPEFMEAVFSLDVGEVGFAVNRPQTEVYVVRVVSQSPDEDQRRQQFLEGGVGYDTLIIAMVEHQRYLEQCNRELDEEMEVKWNRPPDAGLEY